MQGKCLLTGLFFYGLFREWYVVYGLWFFGPVSECCISEEVENIGSAIF